MKHQLMIFMKKYQPFRNMGLGACEFVDGVCRFFSLGYIHTNLATPYLFWYVKKFQLYRGK
jgi:hypothetical protein